MSSKLCLHPNIEAKNWELVRISYMYGRQLMTVDLLKFADGKSATITVDGVELSNKCGIISLYALLFIRGFVYGPKTLMQYCYDKKYGDIAEEEKNEQLTNAQLNKIVSRINKERKTNLVLGFIAVFDGRLPELHVPSFSNRDNVLMIYYKNNHYIPALALKDIERLDKLKKQT